MTKRPTAARLVEVLRAELCARWDRGDRVPAEALFRLHPGVRDEHDAALQLVYQEVLLRERHGPAPHADEYVRRFPQMEDALRKLFAVHQAMESGKSLCPSGDTALDLAAADATAEELPAVTGYELLGELGRGGMAVVYKARHLQLNRVVALKMIKAGAYADARELARFKAEADALARLQHPNIVQVFEVRESGGRPFLTLEYVAGGSLVRRLGGRPRPARSSAALVETLALAMHHAHGCGLVHRDLKPANVLLAEDGTPKITDFGLVKLLRADVAHTQSGDIVGTPSYMAPEQASGQGRGVGPAADVYALGAILYEALTGRPPFAGATTIETLLQVRTQEPVPPRRLQPRVPRDLEAVCLKCLRKEPENRYADAALLADDLRRFRTGVPVTARRVGTPERLWRGCRRQPVVALLGALLALTAASGFFSLMTALLTVLAGGLVAAVGLWLWADRRRERADERARRAEAECRAAERRLQEYCRGAAQQLGRMQGQLSWNYLRMARLFREAGRTADAAEACRQIVELCPRDPARLYLVACELARCATDGPFAEQAVEVLRRAADNGFRDARRADEEPSFGPLRDRADFRAVLAELRRPVPSRPAGTHVPLPL